MASIEANTAPGPRSRHEEESEAGVTLAILGVSLGCLQTLVASTAA